MSKSDMPVDKASSDDRPVTMAVIIGAHGIAGEVRLKLFCENVAALKSYKDYNGGKYSLKNARQHKAGAIARFAEITDRNAAEALRGTELTVARENLPDLADDEYYHADLLGLAVKDENGRIMGHVRAVENYGAGDLLDIRQENGKHFMVPVAQCQIMGEIMDGINGDIKGSKIIANSMWLP